MKSILLAFTAVLFLSGCSAPSYKSTNLNHFDAPEIVIIKDTATRAGFQNTMEKWLTDNNYQYVIKPESSPHDLDKLTIEYVGFWAWDLALFLHKAEIKGFHKGQRVADIEFNAPNNFNLNKYGDADKRISNMMDLMFGKVTVEQANNKL